MLYQFLAQLVGYCYIIIGLISGPGKHCEIAPKRIDIDILLVLEYVCGPRGDCVVSVYRLKGIVKALNQTPQATLRILFAGVEGLNANSTVWVSP